MLFLIDYYFSTTQRVFRGKTGRLAADGIRAANAEALAGQNRSATTMQSLFRAKKEQKQVVAMRARYVPQKSEKIWRNPNIILLFVLLYN